MFICQARCRFNINDIIKELACLSQLSKINKNKISGCSYVNNSELDSFMLSCFKYFNRSNPLHPDVYPGVRKMEAEIITMCGKLMNSPNPDAGSFTSGGTESILLACKCYRDKFKKNKPEIILHNSAHAAFWKAGYYFGIKMVEVDDLTDARPNSNTIAIICSAPTFNYGLIDNIQKVSDICLKHKIGLHVDACLGGFLTPFINSTVCDFRIEGVTSISMDTHKYGCAPKGGSVILYRDKELFKNQMFVKEDWSGGIYATTNMSGSRSGNIVALTWATILFTGADNYSKNAKAIRDMTIHLSNEINKIENLFIHGNPEVCIVAIGSKIYNTLLLSDSLTNKGWKLNVLQNPNSFHLCITNCHTKQTIDNFIVDIKESHEEIINKNMSNNVSTSIYGTTQQIKGTDIIDDVAREYLCCLNYLE